MKNSILSNDVAIPGQQGRRQEKSKIYGLVKNNTSYSLVRLYSEIVRMSGINNYVTNDEK